MTDKEQIIVDRVDVSGCKNLNKVVNEEPYCNIDEEHLYTCSSDENCDYKQLARKTQECEQIKEKYEALKLENQEGYEIVAELKQECEELLKENQQLRNSLSDSLMFKFTGQENETNRYRKALEEIKGYINNQGIDNKWNMRIQRFRSGILDIINKTKDGE